MCMFQSIPEVTIIEINIYDPSTGWTRLARKHEPPLGHYTHLPNILHLCNVVIRDNVPTALVVVKQNVKAHGFVGIKLLLNWPLFCLIT